MSSVILPAEIYSVQKNSTGKKPAVKRIEKVFVGFIVLLLLIIVLELVFHFVISPSIKIDRVVISSDTSFGYTDEYILKQAGITQSETFFRINTRDIEKRLKLIPAVSSVVVKKVFPSMLNIDIKSRIPLGLALISTDKGTVPVVMDKEGIIFSTGPGLASLDLPVVSGLQFPEIKGGMRIPRELCSFLEDLQVIKSSSPGLYRMISEIKFERKGSGDYEVLLYPAVHRVRIRIGSNLDEEMLKYMIMVLEVISTQPGMEKVEEIDFRTGDIVYRIQEG